MIGADCPEEQRGLKFPQEPGPCWGMDLRLQSCHLLSLRDSCPQPIRAAGRGGVSWREGNALQNSLESWLKMSTERPTAPGWSLTDGCILSKKRPVINLCSETRKAAHLFPSISFPQGRTKLSMPLPPLDTPIPRHMPIP